MSVSERYDIQGIITDLYSIAECLVNVAGNVIPVHGSCPFTDGRKEAMPRRWCGSAFASGGRIKIVVVW